MSDETETPKEIALGTVVALNSAPSTPLTVISITYTEPEPTEEDEDPEPVVDTIEVAWFNNRNEMQEAELPVEAVRVW